MTDSRPTSADDDLLLSIDCGTQSVRALLFSGKLLAVCAECLQGGFPGQ